MPLRDRDFSRAISHALRHEPWIYELELDDDGWVDLDALIAALREQREEWRDLSRMDVERMIKSSSKRRHEITGGRIRSLYGHSLPGKLQREPGAPPTLLFHGTSLEAAKTIAHDGLKPMSRQYVHLSVDVPTAREVGRRKSRTPALLEIRARAAHDSGVAFYKGNEKVWLADLVPSRFIRTMP